jgi:hypothetical protein
MMMMRMRLIEVVNYYQSKRGRQLNDSYVYAEKTENQSHCHPMYSVIGHLLSDRRVVVDRETKANKANLVFSLFLPSAMTVSVANTLDTEYFRVFQPPSNVKSSDSPNSMASNVGRAYSKKRPREIFLPFIHDVSAPRGEARVIVNDA